jgi:DNA-directed RNA polymerase subunit RPC12/RpoP
MPVEVSGRESRWIWPALPVQAMSDATEYWELRCPKCSWTEVCGHEGMIRWLRAAKKVRPGREPEDDILVEIFRGSAGQWACPSCGQKGLAVQPARDDTAWADEPLCRDCRKPIPRERLLALPGTTLCAACQRAEELGQGPNEVEYCPRCGAPMALRLSCAGGLSRYVLACTAEPPCRL